MSRLPAFLLPVCTVFMPMAVAAEVAEDLAQCAALTDDGARLTCYDELATGAVLDGAAAENAELVLAALDRAFRFDRSTRVAPLMFRLPVSQYLSVSRETGPGRDVERLARRINDAIGDIAGWSLDIVVHGASVEIPRAQPYSGEELLAQATRAMVRSGLPGSRYEIILGADAAPQLWDDGRVRGSNEHITVEITGL